ncbi:DUF2500 domain-containing protein [Desulfitobacterium sp. THU1]|uniref:DUF2500 domain-containing protein n=1 Tax=Desulfitobacterium sp. THU1 TaxID=3138072 RepID=UPI00312004D5
MFFQSDMMFSVVPILVTIGFVVVFGMIFVGIIQGIRTWRYNNAQPVLIVPSQIVTKRDHVTSHHHNNGSGVHHNHRSTTYYVTFEVESGDRMEFQVQAQEYGMLAEGDIGRLSFQGTRYLGFERLRDTERS